MIRVRLLASGRNAVFALAAAYLSVLAFTPVFHHDFLCHLKSPTHCDACTASPAASGIEQDPPLDSVCWLAAERLDIPDLRPTPLAPSLARAGRAPPA
jgi:hypothetical protein